LNRTLIGAALLLSLAGCATPPTQEELATADYGPFPKDYQDTIRAYFDQTLKDPDSVRYKWRGEPSRGWETLGGKKFGWRVCVDVNAKNSYGGYTGYQTSYFMFQNHRIASMHHGNSRGSSLADMLCSKM
jgi:hypothetical protein